MSGCPLLFVFSPDPRRSRSAGPGRSHACGCHSTNESTSPVAGYRFPRDVILLAVRYYLQLGAAAKRTAGVLADSGTDVSGRTILGWVQKLGPAHSDEIRRFRKAVSTTWLVDETYVKILAEWHDLYRGIDQDDQVLYCCRRTA